jgi:hypothetical protein
MKWISLLIISLFFLSACSPYHSALDSLGSSSSFDDVQIPDDFPGPDEDIIGDIVDPEPDPDEDNLPPPIVVSLKNTFDLDAGTFSLAHGTAKRWNGCSQQRESRGGYNSDSTCGRAFFHPLFADNLNEVFFICISDAARAAGYPQPSRIFINHLGSYNDRNARNSTRLSNHAYARALDIKNFNLVDSEGRTHRISTHINHYQGAQAQFYDEFRDCWKESLPSSCRPGQTEFNGSIGHNSSRLGGNTLHNDHIHLSYPLCAGAS